MGWISIMYTMYTMYTIPSGFWIWICFNHSPAWTGRGPFPKTFPMQKKHIVPMTLWHRNVKSLEIIQNGPKIYFLLMEGSGFKAAVEYSRMWDPQTCHSFLFSTQMMTKLYDFPHGAWPIFNKNPSNNQSHSNGTSPIDDFPSKTSIILIIYNQ